MLVLGDVGRSPRMQYHSVSLCQLPHVQHVDVVGYAGSDVIQELTSNRKVSLHLMPPVFPPAREFVHCAQCVCSS